MTRKRARSGTTSPAAATAGTPHPGWYDRLLVVAVALAASVAGLTNEFTLDDVSLIQENVRAHSVSAWPAIVTSPYWPPPFAQDLYRPVASLLLSAQYLLGAGTPAVFRVVSCLLYAASALAVHRLALRMLPATGALAVALLFAAHPVHVEAVVQGVNQGELIVAILAAVVTCLYVDRRRAGPLTGRDWAVIAVLYAMAALTKENGFVLPALLVAAELSVVPPMAWRDRVRDLWRGYAALAALGVALIGLRTAVLSGNFVGAYTADALVGLGIGARALTMLQVVPRVARLMVWPAHLQADYSPNEIVASTRWDTPETVGFAMVLAAIAIAVLARRRAPVVTLGIAWFAIAIFPVSNLVVPTSIVLAERTLFLPSAGFLLAVAGGIGFAISTATLPALAMRRALTAATALFVILGVVRSTERQRVWRNSAHLWDVTSRDAPRSLRVQRAHREAVADLMAGYEPRIRTAAEPWRVRNELATLLRAMHEDSLAIDQLRRSLGENPAQPDVRAAVEAAVGGAASAVPGVPAPPSPQKRPPTLR